MSLAGAKCCRDKLLHVITPLDDIDFFIPPKFANNRLHANSLLPDTGAYRVYTGLIGIHSNLCASAGFRERPPEVQRLLRRLPELPA